VVVVVVVVLVVVDVVDVVVLDVVVVRSSQRCPVYAGPQVHVNAPPGRLEQVPPFWQGPSVQASKTDSHLTPVNPG